MSSAVIPFRRADAEPAGHAVAPAGNEALRRALVAVQEELGALAQMIESSTNGVSQKFQGIALETAHQTAAFSGLIATASVLRVDERDVRLAELATSLKALFSETVGKVIFLSSRSMSMVYQLEDVLAQMKQVGASVEQIQKISARTNLLAINAKIEAVHAQAAGRGFGVVANEVRELATNSGAISVDLRRQIDATRAGLTNSFAILQELSTVDLSEQHAQSDERVSMIIEGLLQQNQRFSEALEDARAIAERLTAEINSAVMRMQFQDRATQVLANLSQVLGHVALSLDGNAGEGDVDAMADGLTRGLTLGDVKKRLRAAIDGRAAPPAPTAEADAGSASDIELF